MLINGMVSHTGTVAYINVIPIHPGAGLLWRQA